MQEELQKMSGKHVFHGKTKEVQSPELLTAESEGGLDHTAL